MACSHADWVRLPVDPLMALTNLSMNEIDRRIGRKSGYLASLNKRGGIPLWPADECAGAIGEHPAAIWPEWYDIPDEEFQRQDYSPEAQAARRKAQERERYRVKQAKRRAAGIPSAVKNKARTERRADAVA